MGGACPRWNIHVAFRTPGRIVTQVIETPDGLPYSIQFTGRRLSEATLCRVAHAYEQATAWHMRHPAV